MPITQQVSWAVDNVSVIGGHTCQLFGQPKVIDTHDGQKVSDVPSRARRAHLVVALTMVSICMCYVRIHRRSSSGVKMITVTGSGCQSIHWPA